MFEQLLFYVFSGILILSSVMVIALRNSVRCALALVCAFIASAVLWLMMQSEFLALVLILVYVGAVMTLFLFVVMMLNLQKVNVNENFVRYLPFGVLTVAIMVAMLIFAFDKTPLIQKELSFSVSSTYSNVQAIGEILYTDYVYPFELAALLLLIAIVSAIALAFKGTKPDARRQNIQTQLDAQPTHRVELFDITPNSHPMNQGISE